MCSLLGTISTTKRYSDIWKSANPKSFVTKISVRETNFSLSLSEASVLTTPYMISSMWKELCVLCRVELKGVENGSFPGVLCTPGSAHWPWDPQSSLSHQASLNLLLLAEGLCAQVQLALKARRCREWSETGKYSHLILTFLTLSASLCLAYLVYINEVKRI